MGDTFCEDLLECKQSSGSIMIRVLCVLGCAAILLLFGVLGIYTLMLEFFAVYGTYYVFRSTSLEIEYTYINGSFSVDKIYGRSRRKTVFRFEMKNAETVAHEDSDRLDHYLNNPSFKIKDYTSGYPADNRYVAVLTDQQNVSGVLLELGEEMADAMYHDAPSKVYRKKK